MAAKELDTRWDAWIGALSGSYEKAMGLLESKDIKSAAAEFHTHFVPTIKKLYSEAASVYPTRFSKIDDWCAWTKQLYETSLKTEKAFQEGDTEKAAALLPSLREHFHALHSKTQTQRVNDAIYAFRAAAATAQPSADELKKLKEQLEKAPPSTKVAGDAEGFAKARTEWTSKIDAIFEDGKIDPGELDGLRAATESFYRAYGVQFE